MNKKWMLITAGVISIVNGVLDISFLGFIYISWGLGYGSGGDSSPETVIMGIFIGIIGISAITGGILAIIRRLWLIALIGISSPLISLLIVTFSSKDTTWTLIMWFIQGLLLIIAFTLLALSKQQFIRK